MFRFASPWFLALLPLAVAAGFWMWRFRQRQGARVPLPEARRSFRLGRSPWSILEAALPWLRVAVLILATLALARPQAGSRLESIRTEGVDIVVALDNSRSMMAEDFQPRNRLEVAKVTVADFIDGRRFDRIGLVVFAGLARTGCPLTLDREMLKEFLAEVELTSPDDSGTAIGMGLGTAVNRLRDSVAKSRVVVLVTDGRNNTGQLGPEAAAEAARSLGIKVYTIGVGSDGPAPFPVDTPMGRTYRQLRVELDEELLRKVAETTGGRYFRATDTTALREIFRQIDELETTEIESKVRVLYSELFPLFLLPALGLLLLEGLAATTRLRRIP